MGSPLVRPRVSDLVFQVYSRPLHPELFDVLACRKVRRDGYDLTIRVTRTGHVITWQQDGRFLTEVAGAHDPLLPEHRRERHWKIRGERGDSLPLGPGLAYQANVQVEVLPPDLFQHVQDEIRADGLRRGMLVHFQPHQRLAVAPVTLVHAEGRPGCLFLSSFHTFPDEFTVVKTQSLIERR